MPPKTTLDLTPDDLVAAASIARAVLTPALDRDWERPARDLQWSCRRTLDHIADTMLFYSALLATRATARCSPPRNGDPNATPDVLLGVMASSASILADVVRAAPPGTRAFHPAGMADGTGFLGMACQEVLAHTWDIAEALGVPFTPPPELTAKIVARIFPWAPADVPAWYALLWAAGRIALPGHERLDANWYWHCAPLAEWDGTIKRRTAPPAWR